MAKTNWENLILAALKENGESYDDVINSTLTRGEALKEFDNGYGGAEGCAFTAWTDKRVYFPIQYDGAEWVGSAPRNPCNEQCDHQGGG